MLEPAAAPPGAHLLHHKETIRTLQAGRAFAALAVLVHHAAEGVENFGGALPPLLSSIFSYGYLGVDFFFVLSGFIIYYTNQSRGEGWSRKYLTSRALRIYVPYLPIGFAMALAYTALPSLSAGNREWSWFASLTLLPSDSPTALSVAWTLRHEILFYFLFWLAARLGRPFLFMLSWSAAILAYNALFGHPTGAAEFLFALRNMEFLFGMTAAWVVLTDRAQWSSLVYAALAAPAFALVAFVTGAGQQGSVLVGLGLGLLIIPVVRAERAGRISVGTALMLLGNASYSLYLIHRPLVSLGARFLADLHWLMALAVIVMVSISAALIYHLAFERPALRYFSRLLAETQNGQIRTSQLSKGPRRLLGADERAGDA